MSILGSVEFASPAGLLAGWTRDEDHPGAVVELELRLDGILLAYGRSSADRLDIGPNTGYEIDPGQPIRMLDLLTGRLRLQARSSVGDASAVLHPTGRVAELAIEDFIETEVAVLRPEDRAQLLEHLSAEAASAAREAASGRASLQRDRAELERTLSSLPASGPGTETSSSLGLPLGHLSPDGTALLGRDGVLFLVGGSNGLLDRYLQPPDSPEVREGAASWADLFERRTRALADRGIRFLQVIIPEKLGVARDFFPHAIPARSATLQRLEHEIADRPGLAGVCLSVSTLFSGLEPSFAGRAFPRTDSHLSFEGNFVAFAGILRAMGLVPPEMPSRLQPVPLGGDLAERFFGVPLFDETPLPDAGTVEALGEGLEQVEAFEPEHGHIGIRYVWRNRDARHPFKVVAFANSFFERGGDARCLSWWFARTFREFHFVWNPNVDLDYVDRERPDWVIGQTIERFLSLLPQS